MAIVKCCFKSSDVSEIVEVVIQKCNDVGCCCGCCSALRPRYKRLVDNIFPVAYQDGLVKANMEKLTFYSLSSPEKLDRIGEYLYQRAARDIYRKRYGYVIIAMEAMDQLLLACHAQQLNLFVESFLKMVQKLLESTEPQLQILATQSFVKFANIEEDTPSYHRRYDFFVSRFSEMCHSGQSGQLRNSIRVAGIRGLQAVVRKTVSDDLVENIWEQVHMDKIVPSLLFNMQNSGLQTKEPVPFNAVPDDQVDPPTLADSCMRELVGRASFGHVQAVLKPVLRHFDLHKLWVPNEFAINTFHLIIFAVQAQYSYTIVELLMAHLDENKKSDSSIRTSIVDVLSKIIAKAAGESVGPSVLEIINSLLSHLRESVRNGLNQIDETKFQESLINALGEFANHLPDYQKIEIMMFIMSKIPYPIADMHTNADNLLQSILLKSLLKVGTKYQTIQLNTAFPVSFLEPLLNISLSPDPEMRLLVQKILHTLIDRHHNLEKLSKPSVAFMEMDLNLEKSSRPDLIFINKHGAVIYNALYTGLTLETNTTDNIESVCTTLALLCVELACMETIIDLIQLVLGVQSLSLNSAALSTTQKFQLHAVVASLLMLIPNVVHLAPLAEYVERVVGARACEASHLLPELMNSYPPHSELGNKLPHLMFDKMAVCEYLKSCGVDASRLEQSSPYSGSTAPLLTSTGPTSGGGGHRHSWVEATARGSVVEIVAGGIGTEQPDSVGNSPLVSRKYPEQELTFESMKRVLTESPEIRKEAEAEKREILSRTFRTATFLELIRRTKPKQDMLQNTLNEIFKGESPEKTTTTHNRTQSQRIDTTSSGVPVYEQNFPELFLH